ncbi:MAG: hypothetical protein CMH03_03155 [Marinovum sp.]|nr:hypothetical protein [Marinovum sp.]
MVGARDARVASGFWAASGARPHCQKAYMSGLCCIGATSFPAGLRVVECVDVRWLDHGTARGVML